MYVILWLLQNNCDRNERNHWFENCGLNNDKGHVRHIQIKCTIIIIDQYIIAENVPSIVQFHKICNKNNTNDSPSRYWL